MVERVLVVGLVSLVAAGSLQQLGDATAASIVEPVGAGFSSAEGRGWRDWVSSADKPQLTSSHQAMSGASALTRATKIRKLAQVADETADLLRRSITKIEDEIVSLEGQQVVKRAEADKALRDLQAREAEVERSVRNKRDRTLILALFGVPPVVTLASILDAQNADGLIRTLRASKAAAERAVADIDIEIRGYKLSKASAEIALGRLRLNEGTLVDQLGEPLFDLASVSAEELALLPGVGSSVAASLVDARRSVDISSYDGLLSAAGVGERRAEAIARFVEQSNELQWNIERPVRDAIIENLELQRKVVLDLRDDAIRLDLDLDALADDLAERIAEARKIAEQVQQGDEQILKILLDPNPAKAAEKWIKGQAKQRVKKIVRDSFGRPDNALEAELLKRLERAIANAVIR